MSRGDGPDGHAGVRETFPSPADIGAEGTAGRRAAGPRDAAASPAADTSAG